MELDMKYVLYSFLVLSFFTMNVEVKAEANDSKRIEIEGFLEDINFFDFDTVFEKIFNLDEEGNIKEMGKENIEVIKKQIKDVLYPALHSFYPLYKTVIVDLYDRWFKEDEIKQIRDLYKKNPILVKHYELNDMLFLELVGDFMANPELKNKYMPLFEEATKEGTPYFEKLAKQVKMLATVVSGMKSKQLSKMDEPIQ
jgi:hypothetical protein